MSAPTRLGQADGVWQRPYLRVVNGQTYAYDSGARTWTAKDYDLIEKLAGLGLSVVEMTRYFTPPVNGESIRHAMKRADIPSGRSGKKRPSDVERARWAEIWKLWKAGEL